MNRSEKNLKRARLFLLIMVLANIAFFIYSHLIKKH